MLAIWADRDTCKPFTGAGRIGHVVRVSDSPKMTIINEFTDGGSFEHEDCGPASLQSWFIDKARVRTSVKVIETLAGTDLNGTGFTGLINAGQHFGEQIKFSGDNPTPGYIMNPGGFTTIVDISEFDSYLAATQGGCLVLPNIVWNPAPTPTPSLPLPTPHQEDSRMFTIINFGAQEGTYIVYDDHVLVGIYSEPDVTTLAKLPTCHGEIELSPQMLQRYQAAEAAAKAKLL